MKTKTQQCSGVTSARLYLAVIIAFCLYSGQYAGVAILVPIYFLLEIFK